MIKVDSDEFRELVNLSKVKRNTINIFGVKLAVYRRKTDGKVVARKFIVNGKLSCYCSTETFNKKKNTTAKITPWYNL